jgi:hypothetical protein
VFMEEYKGWMLENKMLKKIYGAKPEEICR